MPGFTPSSTSKIDMLLTRLTATRAAYLDNLIGTQPTGTISHANGTTEDDDLIVTPTELAKYERLILDMNGLAQTTTIRTHIKVDGTNYRLQSVAVFPTDFPANVKAVEIELVPTSRMFKVTLQSAVAEGGAVNIPYFYVARSLA